MPTSSFPFKSLMKLQPPEGTKTGNCIARQNSVLRPLNYGVFGFFPSFEAPRSTFNSKFSPFLPNFSTYLPEALIISIDSELFLLFPTPPPPSYLPLHFNLKVRERVRLAREAQKEWAKTSFSQRRNFLKILQKFIVDNQEIICRSAQEINSST